VHVVHLRIKIRGVKTGRPQQQTMRRTVIMKLKTSKLQETRDSDCSLPRFFIKCTEIMQLLFVIKIRSSCLRA
jgi:hypothetical protein